jgi:hypothetical protein
MIFLEYPVTRSLTFSRWVTVLTVIGAGLFVAFVTVVNVAAVGYDMVSVTSNVYGIPDQKLWYSYLVPSSWVPESMTCEPSIIQLNEGLSHPKIKLTEAVSTHNQVTYNLIGYINGNGTPVEGMQYSGSPLRHCAVEWMSVIEPLDLATQFDVSRRSILC